MATNTDRRRATLKVERGIFKSVVEAHVAKRVSKGKLHATAVVSHGDNGGIEAIDCFCHCALAEIVQRDDALTITKRQRV